MRPLCSASDREPSSVCVVWKITLDSKRIHANCNSPNVIVLRLHGVFPVRRPPPPIHSHPAGPSGSPFCQPGDNPRPGIMLSVVSFSANPVSPSSAKYKSPGPTCSGSWPMPSIPSGRRFARRKHLISCWEGPKQGPQRSIPDTDAGQPYRSPPLAPSRKCCCLSW
jgi:hypothetical protein